MKYLRKYNTREEYDADYYSGALPFPHVCLVDGEVVYSQEFDAAKEERLPLYIEAIEDLTIYFTTNAIQYSLDNSTWIDLAANEATPTISAGDKVYFRASGLSASSSAGIGTFNVSGRFNVRGNVMSMAYGADFIDQKIVSKSRQFFKLFYGQINLVSANGLVLPATKLATYCYASMFAKCLNLTQSPECLPATYTYSYCYTSMFYGCTSLVNAPALPATTLASNCYSNMFQNCANLAYIKAMFTTTPSSSYLSNWVSGVAASGTFVKNSAATWEDTFGASAIPTGWTVDTADA